MRESNSWHLADPEELERRRAARARPLGRVRMLAATATHVTLVGPLLACNPKGPWDDDDFDGDWGESESGTDTDAETETETDTDTESTGDGDGDGDPIVPCVPLAPPEGEVIVVGPDQALELSAIAAAAAPGTTIQLSPGIYDLSTGAPIRLSTPGVTLRSATDERDSVVLDGGDLLDELVVLEASNTRVAHLTLQRARSRAIVITGGEAGHTSFSAVHDVVVRDPGGQAITLGRSAAGFYPDQGEIACSRIELDDAGRAALETCELAGIDARGARGWDVHDNHLIGWWCGEGLAGPAIRFWQSSRDTIIQRNAIEDSAIGIALGGGELGADDERVYVDQPCPDAIAPGHIDGIVRNNTIWSARPELFASVAGVHSGITLERACGARVLHNTAVSLGRTLESIALRWPDTHAIVVNNLVTHGIHPYADAEVEFAGNVADAPTSEFVDALLGDLHLSPTAAAIDAGVELPQGLADDDMDAQPRTDTRDVGADEHTP
ncbi:hypothetical protein ACNOYE_33405 [Nannocystaceae bacterium ST9]